MAFVLAAFVVQHPSSCTALAADQARFQVPRLCAKPKTACARVWWGVWCIMSRPSKKHLGVDLCGHAPGVAQRVLVSAPVHWWGRVWGACACVVGGM